ncbi:nucleoside hydrolase [Granulicella sp. dw_53]|uniref:nucleoside hydrolase n=1 Tax=Granulicella sp. dw_53 TaxID=2719792 RepID=UPI002106C6E5|nr:nucleoside hydrolase [Granulicella sp. dw_53]
MSLCAGLTLASAQSKRLVIMDQDGSGPGGSNQMAMMVLLQSPQVQVLGLTMVSGDAWEPEEVQHTLRMLELIHRSDVPVVPGAVFPLLHTERDAKLDRQREGTSPWYGAWGDVAAHTSNRPYHAASVVPKLVEGEPSTKPSSEDAAHFLVRQVRAHPHEVTICAAGPLTNIALAISIDPEFAQLTKGIVIMGGSMKPETEDPEFASNPRHEFNFWFDPEAAHITLRADWPRVDLTTVDLSVKTHFTRQMLDEISTSHQPAAQYLTRYTEELYYLWDELTAAAWIEPSIITAEKLLYVDVDVTRGPSYGNTLTWSAEFRPESIGEVHPIHVQTDLDVAKFNRMFVEGMKAPPQR